MSHEVLKLHIIFSDTQIGTFSVIKRFNFWNPKRVSLKFKIIHVFIYREILWLVLFYVVCVLLNVELAHFLMWLWLFVRFQCLVPLRTHRCFPPSLGRGGLDLIKAVIRFKTVWLSGSGTSSILVLIRIPHKTLLLSLVENARYRQILLLEIFF